MFDGLIVFFSRLLSISNVEWKVMKSCYSKCGSSQENQNQPYWWQRIYNFDCFCLITPVLKLKKRCKKKKKGKKDLDLLHILFYL